MEEGIPVSYLRNQKFNGKARHSLSDRIAHCTSNVPQYGILLLNRKMLKIG